MHRPWAAEVPSRRQARDDADTVVVVGAVGICRRYRVEIDVRTNACRKRQSSIECVGSCPYLRSSAIAVMTRQMPFIYPSAAERNGFAKPLLIVDLAGKRALAMVLPFERAAQREELLRMNCTRGTAQGDYQQVIAEHIRRDRPPAVITSTVGDNYSVGGNRALTSKIGVFGGSQETQDGMTTEGNRGLAAAAFYILP